MRLLYLDIDGVLNGDGLGRRAPVPRRSSPRLDPVRVARLDLAIGDLEVGVVLTSSWRHRMGRALLERLLRQAGLHAEIVSATPRLAAGRGVEIAMHLDVARGSHVDRVVILDDGPPSDFGALARYLVRTRGSVGLTAADAIAVRERLVGATPVP